MPKTRRGARSDRRFSNLKPLPLRATFGRFSSWVAWSDRDGRCLPRVCVPMARMPLTGASYPICATLESGLFRDSGREASSAWKWGDCWMLPAWRWPVFPSRGGGSGNAGERKSALPELSNGGTAKRLAKKANRRRAQGGRAVARASSPRESFGRFPLEETLVYRVSPGLAARWTRL